MRVSDKKKFIIGDTDEPETRDDGRRKEPVSEMSQIAARTCAAFQAQRVAAKAARQQSRRAVRVTHQQPEQVAVDTERPGWLGEQARARQALQSLGYRNGADAAQATIDALTGAPQAQEVDVHAWLREQQERARAAQQGGTGEQH